MAEYQVVDKIAHDAELKSIGDSIRAKGGTTAPFNSAAEMKAAVDAIQTGGGGDTATEDALVTGGITSYSNDRITVLGSAVFQGQKSLKELNLPNLTKVTINNSMAESGLEHIYFPNLLNPGTNPFKSCTSLLDITLPSIFGFPSCNGCSNLKKIDLYENTASAVFINADIRGCVSLDTLILRKKGVALLNKFQGGVSPIEKGTGYIYVPRALVDQYKTATNWVKYADQIRAIEDYPEITGG